MLKIGIVGYGFVGKALHHGFSGNLFYIIDPATHPDSTYEGLKEFDPGVVFVCVPTPMSENGGIDSTIIMSVIESLSSLDLKCPIVVKSTITPDVAYDIMDKMDVVYNPEFLTEANYVDDFVDSWSVVLGGSVVNVDKVMRIYRNHSDVNENAEYVLVNVIDAVFIKYITNTFLATKVTFFNEMKSLYDEARGKAGDNWDEIIKALALDDRMGHSHMMVPGHDGRYWAGGSCFPKDMAALVYYSKLIGASMTVLEQAEKTNRENRSKLYDEPLDREKAQNVKFK